MIDDHLHFGVCMDITLKFWIDFCQFQNRIMTLNQLLSQLLPIETHNFDNKQGKDVFVLEYYEVSLSEQCRAASFGYSSVLTDHSILQQLQLDLDICS